MKIAIEAQRIFRLQKHGMDIAILETIKELQHIDQKNEYFILVSPGPDRCLTSNKNFHIIEIKCPTYPLWEQVALPYTLKKINPDLLHCTSNTAPLFIGKCSLILTLHDVIFMDKKIKGNTSWYQKLGWYYRRFITPQVVSKCKEIITVSQNAREEICRKFPKANKPTVIYNGYNSQFHTTTNYFSLTQKYCPKKNYFFFLGNTDPRKNTRGVLLAYAKYIQQTKSIKPLVISSLLSKDIQTILQKENITSILPYLHFTGYIPIEDLIALYNGAYAFLYPSISEGFGIPILEAMSCGTPVITSRVSAMPEIAGEKAILINPDSSLEIANALLRLENDENYRQQQIAYGLERAKLFSWKQTATQLLKVYQQLKP